MSKDDYTLTSYREFAIDNNDTYSRELFLEDITNALDILEEKIIVDYTNIQLVTRLNKNKYDVQFKLKTDGINFSNRDFDDIISDKQPKQLEDIEVDFSEILITIINSYLIDNGLDTVSIEQSAIDLSIEQRKAIIECIKDYFVFADGDSPISVNEILEDFGFGFDENGDLI